jgi:PAS domain S-box-containing protein
MSWFRELMAPLRLTLLYAIMGGLWILVSVVAVGELYVERSTALRLALLNVAIYSVMAGVILYNFFNSYSSAAREFQQEYERRTEMLQLIFDASPLATFAIAPDGRVTMWNRAAERVFGLPGGRVGERGDVPFLEEKREELAQAIRRLLTGEELVSFETRRTGRDGMPMDLNLYMSPLRAEDGRVRGAMAVAVDITRQKVAQDALADSERRFRSAFEDAAIGMALTGADGSFLEVNESLCRMLGYAKDELKGKNFRNITHPDDLQASLDVLRKVNEGAIASFHMEKRYVHRDGHTVWVALSGSVVKDPEGRPLYTVAQMQDITERKKAEEELRRYSTDLEAMVKERTEDLERVHALLLEAGRLAAVGSVAAQVAHDLRNPLTAINTNLFYLSEAFRDKVDEKVKESIKTMQAAVSHANKIVEDLLEYSRPTELKVKGLPLRPIVNDTIGSMEIPSDVKLNVRIPASAKVDGDASKLMRVFRNVILNAVESMPKGGELEIASDVRGDKVVTTIRDTGEGIREADMAKLFTPFFTTKARGLGLGLSICKRLVEAHGGTIEVKSRPGQGTTVSIVLPRSGAGEGGDAGSAEGTPADLT